MASTDEGHDDEAKVLSPNNSGIDFEFIEMREAICNEELVSDLVKENSTLKAQLDAAEGEKDHLNRALEEQKEESNLEKCELKQSIQQLQEENKILNSQVQEMINKELQNLAENMVYFLFQGNE